jgi:hypothetical protein
MVRCKADPRCMSRVYGGILLREHGKRRSRGSAAPPSLAGAIAMTVPPFISGMPASRRQWLFLPSLIPAPWSGSTGHFSGACHRRRRRTIPDEDRVAGVIGVSRSNLAERRQGIRGSGSVGHHCRMRSCGADPGGDRRIADLRLPACQRSSSARRWPRV